MLRNIISYNLYQGQAAAQFWQTGSHQTGGLHEVGHEAPTDFFQEIPVELEDDIWREADRSVPATAEPYETVHETVHQQTTPMTGRRSHFYFNDGNFAEDCTRQLRHEEQIQASLQQDISDVGINVLRTSKIDEAFIAERLIHHVMNKNYKAIEEIVQAGPWVNSISFSGARAYSIARQTSNIDAMRLLLRYGAVI